MLLVVTTTSITALLVCCSCVLGATTRSQNPQNFVYVAQAPPQHYGVVPPYNYNYNPGYYDPIRSPYTPATYPSGYNPQDVRYNPPVIGYTPQGYAPPQQFYYHHSPPLRYPTQFMFVYPGYGNSVVPVPPSVPESVPQDETGDSEVLTSDEEVSDREPLIPALSGPETGKRAGLPEKQIKDVSSIIRRILEQPGFTKAAVQHRPVEDVVSRKVERDTLLQARMDKLVDAQSQGESRGWKRRLAPNLQSVYLDAEEDEENDKKKKEEVADSVVVHDTPAGPSVASVKPAAIALAGPGGVASASPVGTAVVGPGGLAVAAPSATAVAGPSGGVPPGSLGAGGASARSNMRLHQILETLYGKPARQVAFRTAPSAYTVSDDDDYDFEQ